MKRVLVISYYWPPTGGSGVQRWVKFAKYLPSEGWQPVIYTPLNPERLVVDEELGAEVPREVEVIRRKIVEPYSIYRFLTGKGGASGQRDRSDGAGGGNSGGGISDGSGAEAGKNIREDGYNGIIGNSRNVVDSREVNPLNAGEKRGMEKIAMKVRGNCFIPDPRCLWVRPSVKFLKKYLREHPVDMIVSTGPPHSMHLIGRKLALATGLPWIADFRDPWTKMFYFKHLPLSERARRRHYQLEQEVLRDASAVVAVSPLVRDDFRAMTSTRVELITNGFDEDDFREEGNNCDVCLTIKDGDRLMHGTRQCGMENGSKEVGEIHFWNAEESRRYFNITHTGLFAADGNPDVLWEVLSEKCRADAEFRARLRVRFVGKTDKEVVEAIRAAGLGENIVDRGYVTHREAVREQRGASVLMLPLRKEPEYKAVLPGKVFEYLAADRPVLGIGQTDGAMASLLTASKAGIVADWRDKAAMAEFLDSCWEKFRSGQQLKGAEDIGKYSRARLTKEYAALMDSLIAEENREIL